MTYMRYRLILGTTLALLLLFSSINIHAFAATTYKFFNGAEYIEIPSTKELRLQKFVIEASFRLTEQPTKFAFLVSKGGWGNNKPNMNNNYALFITKEGTVGGGFKDENGLTHYVYMRKVVDGKWHNATLTYDGGKLELVVDNNYIASKNISTTVSTSISKPLRIGASSNTNDYYYKGDIDYIKVIDLSTGKIVYYNEFDNSGGGGNGGSGGNIIDCSNRPMKELVGMGFYDPILTSRESGLSFKEPANYLENSMRIISNYGFTFLRVPANWEAYVARPQEFLDRLDLIAQTADKYGLCIVYTNFHWMVSSKYAGSTLPDGKKGTPNGFPSYILTNYPKQSNLVDSVKPFWRDFWQNKITVNGKNVWDLQLDYLKVIVGTIDKYKSVAGYEILNEPWLTDAAQYDQLGNYYTYMAKELRKVTAKKIFFDRETAWGFTRMPENEYKIVPKNVDKLVYSPQLYSVPSAGSYAETVVDRFKTWSNEWGVEVLITEFTPDTQTNSDTSVKAFKDRGFGWTAWAWRVTQDVNGLATQLYEDEKGPTQALKNLVNSLNKYY
ncbi:MAG: LamG-like jellyroll fold domain-containing protein [Candidatus Nitrosocaldaceae archaeon]